MAWDVSLHKRCDTPARGRYPSEPPTFDLSNPNNAAFLADVKQDILSGLRDQAAAAAGEAMMFNLAVWAQENLGGFIARSLAREKVGGGGASDGRGAPP